MATAQESPKEELPHRHHADIVAHPGSDDLNTAAVQDGYFKSAPFVGTMFAAGFGMIGASGGFALPASVLAVINNDIGPDPNYFWIGLVFTLMLSVGFTLVGRITDIFGRRYFLVGGTTLSMIGTIVASQAHSVPTLIGATVLIGLGAVAPSSVAYVVAELVPMKHRYLVLGLMFLWMVPVVALGPAVAWGFVLHTKAGWRWCYYLMTITNGISTILWLIFYHPPTFEQKNTKTRTQLLRSFDWIGLVLYTGGLVVFLIGLSWGGSVHPWKSAQVVAPIIVGGCALVVFVIYECFAPLSEPLVPMHLFRSLDWDMTVIVTAIAASCYYGFSIIFPQMVFGIYTTDLQYGSYLACAGPGSFLLGMTLGFVSRYVGKQKWQIIATSLAAVGLLGGIACATVDNKTVVLGLLSSGAICIGYIESVGWASAGIVIENQEEIGTAVGIASTIRSTWSTITTTIYLVVLQNRLAVTVPQELLPALTDAGLPGSSIPDFIAALSSGAFTSVPGITPAIIAVGTKAYKQAMILAFRSVFYTALAFLLVNLTAALFFPNLDHMMTDDLAAKLGGPGLLRGDAEQVKHGEHVKAEKIEEP